jgi:hypothetical protein
VTEKPSCVPMYQPLKGGQWPKTMCMVASDYCRTTEVLAGKNHFNQLACVDSRHHVVNFVRNRPNYIGNVCTSRKEAPNIVRSSVRWRTLTMNWIEMTHVRKHTDFREQRLGPLNRSSSSQYLADFERKSENLRKFLVRDIFRCI